MTTDSIDLFNRICEALGLFDGARPLPPQHVLWTEILPAIAALKANNPEAAIVVEENQRTHRLWREALKKMVDANRRADGFLNRWREVEDDRQFLRTRVADLEKKLKTATTDSIKALANSGINTDCGACMEIAFTGTTTATHICEPKE